MREYDHVFVASDAYARRLVPQLGDKVSPLLQCTDPGLFFRDVDDSLDLPEILFVGNSRGQRREVVQYAMNSGADFCVYGGNWNGIIPEDMVKGEHIPNNTLRRYYSSCKIVLNDHWPDMRSEGFISNRLFDAGACGAMILSDHVDGMQDVFDDAVRCYTSQTDFIKQLSELLDEKSHHEDLSLGLSQNIMRNHTYDCRAQDIMSVISRIRGD